jgi:hypothetical protein
MTRLARVRSPGGWTGDLHPEDLRDLDIRQFRAITKRGGAWFAQDAGIGGSNFIGIAGAQGLEITGPSRLDKVTDLHFGTGIQLQYETREVTRELPLYRAGGPGWTFGPSPQEIRPIRYGVLAPVLYQSSTSDAPEASIPLRLPVGCTLKRFAVKLRGNHNAGDPPPEEMPAIRLRRSSHDGSASVGPLTVDPSETVAELDADHEIAVDLSAAFNGTEQWQVLVLGERGEDSATGLIVWSLRVTIELSIHDEWIV